MSNKDFSDFLITEYENIAAAFFNSREVLAKWVKYYLLVMAAPFSFIAFIYKDKPEHFNIFALPSTLSILIVLIGFIGMLLSFIIIEAGIDSVLYARTVNGVRKYFTEQSSLANASDFIVLPIRTDEPSYFGYADLFWVTLITGIINSFYVSVATYQLFKLDITHINQMAYTVIMFILLIISHIIYYKFASYAKNKKYGN